MSHLSNGETAVNNHLCTDRTRSPNRSVTDLLLCRSGHFSLLSKPVSSSDSSLPGSHKGRHQSLKQTPAMLRILWGYANRHLLPLPLITFPTSARGLATPSNSAKPLLGHAPRPGLSRSNLVLSPLLIQKGLQQLAQAGSLSYKKLMQLPIPHSF